MMLRSRSSLAATTIIVAILTLFHVHVAAKSCREDERSALWQFKRSFVIDKSASSSGEAYPKVSSWKLAGKSSNCCVWDGIECDEKTRHVISVDLQSSCLYGSIDSGSSLFRLSRLKVLILSDNHFNFSLIPSGIGALSRLTHLDLSDARFSGQIPLEISRLSKLTYLDLSADSNNPMKAQTLKLENPDLRRLTRNLTGLEMLTLASVHMPSRVPGFLADFLSLKSIDLKNSGIYGKFPPRIFYLPNLQTLDLRGNKDLTGYIPEFTKPSPLELLAVSDTGFSGTIPSSIEKLESLLLLYLDSCNFSRPLPSSLGKLTQLIEVDLGKNLLGGYFPTFFQNLTQLYLLSLNENQMIGQIPSWLGKLSQLTSLHLEDNQLRGSIPSSIQNLTQLTDLSLQNNQLTGPIPSAIGNISQLNYIDLRHNQLFGSFPSSLTKLSSLETLDLSYNNLSGTLRFDMFLNMESLGSFSLCYSGVSLICGERNHNATVSKFKNVSLCRCNLTKFPSFIKYQNKLEWLELSENGIRGKVPEWMWSTSTDTLIGLDLSNNFLTGFEQAPEKLILPWHRLIVFSIGSNMFRGPLPIPPRSTVHYVVANNKLSGEIPLSLCNLSSIWMLDVSNNSFSGEIPRCFANFSESLKVLNMRNNFLRGQIPAFMCSRTSNLTVLDFSRNHFQGKLPQSLATCLMLESIDIKENQFVDVFPAWLGNLRELKHLILGKNMFYGVIRKPARSSEFPKLRVIDLSSNNFTGDLPSEYISRWTAMKAPTLNSISMEAVENINVGDEYEAVHGVYSYSFTIMNKGLELNYEKIQSAFAAIDFSSNRFSGVIPEIIGSLEGLRSVNLSNNELTGLIPKSFGNLSNLESLDLSDNVLSGEIPEELVQLNFLQKFDVSRNNLTGEIPEGNHFDTFEKTSFASNPGLCGKPLSKECPWSKSPPPHSATVHDDSHSESRFVFDWKFILAGFISGLIVGFSLGDIAIMRRPRWYVKILGPSLVRKILQRRRG